MVHSKQSSFLTAIPKGMVDERSTVKARSTGRAVLSSMFGRSDSSWSRSSPGRSTSTFADDSFEHVPAARRRAGTPVDRRVEPEDESQDAATLAVGVRVTHRKFGVGTIAELSGAGRAAKVKIDFDDESVGRKTLVVAQANLESSVE
jgi:DNA helicase-2/ATP-dependent DNA helicase PcrA